MNHLRQNPGGLQKYLIKLYKKLLLEKAYNKYDLDEYVKLS